jgi:hypothetical protein
MDMAGHFNEPLLTEFALGSPDALHSLHQKECIYQLRFVRFTGLFQSVSKVFLWLKALRRKATAFIRLRALHDVL